MKIKQAILLVIIFSVCIPSYSFFKNDNTFIDKNNNKGFFGLFSNNQVEPNSLWETAADLFDNEKFKKAEVKFRTFYKSFPDDERSHLAVLMHGHSLMKLDKPEEAFYVYQFCIDNYSHKIEEYDDILNLQLKAAKSYMNRTRMTLISGGYKSPELSIPLLEQIVSNNPEWSKSAEVLFLMGEINQNLKKYEEAILLYKKIVYQFSESLFYEKAFWKHIQCLTMLLEKYPNSSEIQNRLLSVSTLYLNKISSSDKRKDIIVIRNQLYEIKAKKLFDQGIFYKNIIKNDKAAILSFQSMINNYPKSKLVSNAFVQIEFLDNKND